MMVFRISFLLTFFTFLFSCVEKDEGKVPASDVVKRRLFDIKSIRYIIPNNSFEYYDKISEPYLEVTLKNVSNFDLDCYYNKKYPLHLWACDAYINYPSSGTCIFDVDTSRLIKKNEEFIVSTGWSISMERFYKYEFQGVRFQILISSSHNLSFYFENNPNKPWFKRTSIGNNNRKIYAYLFEFTYWVPNDIFWEDHLLEHPPPFYLQKSTDDK